MGAVPSRRSPPGQGTSSCRPERVQETLACGAGPGLCLHRIQPRGGAGSSPFVQLRHTRSTSRRWRAAVETGSSSALRQRRHRCRPCHPDHQPAQRPAHVPELRASSGQAACNEVGIRPQILDTEALGATPTHPSYRRHTMTHWVRTGQMARTLPGHGIACDVLMAPGARGRHWWPGYPSASRESAAGRPRRRLPPAVSS